jgi:hypothetical protein
LQGQAIIERGVLDGRSAAGAAGVGKSVTGVLGQIGKTMNEATKVEAPKPAPAVRPPAPEPELEAPKPPAPATPAAPVDFGLVVAGMDRAELMKLVGKPSMSVSGVESSLLRETYWYQTATESITVILRDGKVVSITRVPKSASK